MQGGRLLRAVREHGGDLAHLRAHARVGDHARASAVCDGAAGIRHVGAVAEGGVRRDDLFRVLFRGHALARERGFLDLERRGRDEAHIRGDDVARFQLDDVAGDDLLTCEMPPLAVAQHLGKCLVHILQGFHGVLRLVLLDDADDRVQDDDEQDDAGVDELAVLSLHEGDDRGDYRRHDEHDDHDVLELLQELDDQALFLRLFERVLAVLGGALLRLCGGKTLLRRGKCGEDFVRGLVVTDELGLSVFCLVNGCGLLFED